MKSTTRPGGRVVWILLIVLLLFLSLSLIFRLSYTRDKTSSFKPDDTVESIRIIKTTQTITILQPKLGAQTLLPGTPWSFNDAINWSKREFSLHANQQGDISVTIDNVLPADVIKLAEQYGYQVAIKGGRSLISKNTPNNENDPVTRYAFKLLLPQFDGELITYGDKRVISPININKKGVRIRIKSEKHQPASWTSFSQQSEITARYWLEPGVFNGIAHHGAFLTMANDELGTAYHLLLETDELNLEELAKLGQDIINRQSLSTLEWTIKDGAIIQEIVVEDKEVSSQITSEANTSFITLRNQKGDVVRLTKSPTNITISNREIALSSANSVKSSSCIHSELFAKTSIFKEQDYFSKLLQNFDEIAIKPKVIVLCW